MLVGKGGRWANSFGGAVWVRVSVAIFYICLLGISMLKMQDIGKDEVGARGCYRNGEVTPRWAISARLPRRAT
jgi:hypothetical protein